jgi:hypothetical protein
MRSTIGRAALGAGGGGSTGVRQSAGKTWPLPVQRIDEREVNMTPAQP